MRNAPGLSCGGRPASCLASEESAVRKAQPRGIAMPPGRQARGAPAGREQPWNGRAGTVEHLAVGRSLQAAEGEEAEVAGLEVALERNERRLVERGEDRGLLVEQRIAALAGVRVVELH